MRQDSEIIALMQSIAEKGIKLLNHIKNMPDEHLWFLEQWIDVSKDFQHMFTSLFKNPELVGETHIAYCQDAYGLMQKQLQYWQDGKSMPIQNKRFSRDVWIHHPFFNLLSQHYILAYEHFNALLEKIDYGDPVIAKRTRFLAQQYLDALSPEHFIHTNPQLLAETIRCHGKNLLRGLDNLLSDIDVDSARLVMKMTDMQAFNIGENLATTPGKVIYKNAFMELIQYTPQTDNVKSTPLLIIPPWINKYYILDLSPHNSLVRWLISQGIQVFLISWINPTEQFADKDLSDYLHEGPMQAIKIIQKQLKVKQINALGFCIGGTLLAMLLAYLKAQDLSYIRSATFLATMIDFSYPGDISVYIDEAQVTKLEERMYRKGYLDGYFMANAFNSLRASDLIWSFFIKNYLQATKPVPFDMLYWNADYTNMPATMHSQYLRWMYLQNDLIKPGKIRIRHTPLDITKIDTPSFFIATQNDHIAPWKTVFSGYQLFKGPKHFLLGGSGHIAGIIIPPGKEKYGYYNNNHENITHTAEQWLKDASHYTGSWWPEWLHWLNNHSGSFRLAASFEKLPYQAIGDAPGTYVYQKA